MQLTGTALFRKLKSKWGSPVTAHHVFEKKPEEYCVGGTLCCYAAQLQDGPLKREVERLRVNARRLNRLPYASIKVNFPSNPDLASLLLAANTALGSTLARYYADYIISNNDNGRYEKAWSYLKEALEYKNVTDGQNPL